MPNISIDLWKWPIATICCPVFAWASSYGFSHGDSCEPDDRLVHKIATWEDVESVLSFRSDADPSVERVYGLRDSSDKSIVNDMRFRKGSAFLLGKHEERDPQRAFGWFLRAAQDGDVEAAFVTAYLYANGEGTTSSCTEAKKWFCAAGDGGMEEVKFAMGIRCSATTTRFSY